MLGSFKEEMSEFKTANFWD